MKYQLEQPQTDLEPQIKKLFSFVLETSEQANLADPRTLVEGWYGGQIKIFSASADEQIKGLVIVLVIKDPIVAMKYHLIHSLEAGEVSEEFKRYVDNALVVYS